MHAVHRSLTLSLLHPPTRSLYPRLSPPPLCPVPVPALSPLPRLSRQTHSPWGWLPLVLAGIIIRSLCLPALKTHLPPPCVLPLHPWRTVHSRLCPPCPIHRLSSPSLPSAAAPLLSRFPVIVIFRPRAGDATVQRKPELPPHESRPDVTTHVPALCLAGY